MLDILNFKDYSVLVLFFTYAVLLPGYLLTRLIFPPEQLGELASFYSKQTGNIIQRYFYYIFAPALGLILLDAAVLFLDRMKVDLGFWQLFLAFLAINAGLFAIDGLKNRREKKETQETLLNRRFFWFFAAIWVASVAIRAVFYLPDVVPQDTDLGHHMYFSEWIFQQERLPEYDTSEVVVGEHLVFAVLSKLSGVSILSALALLILAFYNLLSVVALYFISLALSSNQKIALLALFFSGIYFAVDPPGARYIKGGVVGNTFGNLFIALIFLLVFMFFRWFFHYCKKSEVRTHPRKLVAPLFSLFLVIFAGLFYTHHLSTFLLLIMLILVFAFFLALPFALKRKEAKANLRKIGLILKNLFLAPRFLFTLAIIVLFPLFIYLPYYLKEQAVETVIGTPVKDTRIGIQLDEAPGKFGLARTVFALVGLGYVILYLLYAASKRFTFVRQSAFLRRLRESYQKRNSLFFLMYFLVFFGWFLPLSILSFFPQWVKIDLPSRRVINYQIYPVIAFSALGAYLAFRLLANRIKSRKMFAAVAGLVLAGVLWDGTSDFRAVYSGKNKFEDAVALFHASGYLAGNTPRDAVIIKDHRSIAGDSWIKFFVMRGYDYFLSRTYDYKYGSVDSKLDICTKETVDLPASDPATDCFGQKGINYVVLKPQGDDFLFWKEKDFKSIYFNDYIVIFKR
ncbi:MAG: nicotinamide mononucleotide transporter [Candidatus Moranbacteria bacterium]|nr:nicotinamide mononucleotide transporter [Candidatus Moranbacteria bacterium]